MTRVLSPTLTNEMNSLIRTSASRVTVERWLPLWTPKITGLSAGKLEQYAHGHSAAVAPNGHGSGEDILCRVRSGSYASPQDGVLYVAIIKGTSLDTPQNWDSLWVSTGQSGVMFPAWTANSGASHGGSIAVVSTGTDFQVFYLKSTGDLCTLRVSYAGVITGVTVIASLGVGAQLASMQLAACMTNEVFVVVNSVVEASQAAWQKPVYGSTLSRYIFSGSWILDSSFHHHTHAEAGLFRDGPLLGSDFSNTSAVTTTLQWGKRFCGGLAASQIDANTVLLSMGLTHWYRWGYDTHSHGLITFLYRRDSGGYWERGPETDTADFTEGNRLRLVSLVRGCSIEGSNFLVWNRDNEPSDFLQTSTTVSLPRIKETVMAKLSSDGKYLTQFQYLGDPDNLSAACLLPINHSEAKKLYALGWRSVYESQPAAFLCSVTNPQDLASYAKGWRSSRNNRRGMSVDVDLHDPSLTFVDGSVVQGGNLVRAYYGLPDELVQVAQGHISMNDAQLNLSNGQLSEGASLTSRADEWLLHTRTEYNTDVAPQALRRIDVQDPASFKIERGHWTVTSMTWPDLFFPGQYTALQNMPGWRLWSFPLDNNRTSGSNLVLSSEFSRTHLAGSWFKDICWLDMSPLLDGSVEASVRFGNNTNQGNFYKSYNRLDAVLYTIVYRTNGIVTSTYWSKYAYGGGNFFPGPTPPNMNQDAIMAGLICHAPETGRKYAFVWECDSRLSTRSWTGGPWSGEQFDNPDYSAHGTGANRLYLVESDYNGSSWITKSVASLTSPTGLTVGHPADLKMQILGGTIFCYYRTTSTTTPNQWRLAFSYKAGRFGPGRFGIMGRGGSPYQYLKLLNGIDQIARLNNEVDFWNISISDGSFDRTLEDQLQQAAWLGSVPTQFNAIVKEASRVVPHNVRYSYNTPVENLAIDFKLNTSSGAEAGVFLRGVSLASPTNDCIFLGLVPHSSTNSAASLVNYYVVKRRYSGGSEVTSARGYSPVCVHLYPGVALPVRVTVRGPIYSLWIAGNLAGTFVDTTPLGLYFGLYSTGATATFSDIFVPELYEIPGRMVSETNQTVDEIINKIIGKRRIKGFYSHDGILKFSYFLSHSSGPDITEQLWQSSPKRSPRYLSKVRVQGTGAHAYHQVDSLAARGQRFQVFDNPNITLREFAYREAVAIIQEIAERQYECTFTGLPDPRLDPEDVSTFVVPRQEAAGDFIIDDISFQFSMGQSMMTISTRQSVVL